MPLVLNAKFIFKGMSPTNHFRRDSQANECPTTLSQTVFTQRNFVADFLQVKCDFRRKSAILLFWVPLWRVRDNVQCSSWARWKACSGFPISVNWTFFTRCYGWAATNEKR